MKYNCNNNCRYILIDYGLSTMIDEHIGNGLYPRHVRTHKYVYKEYTHYITRSIELIELLLVLRRMANTISINNNIALYYIGICQTYIDGILKVDLEDLDYEHLLKILIVGKTREEVSLDMVYDKLMYEEFNRY